MASQILGLEHKIIRRLKPLIRPGDRILIASSGGVDSTVVAEVLWRWRRHLGVELALAHVHHGRVIGRPEVSQFRSKAKLCVEKYAREHEMPFFTNGARTTREVGSEASLRAYRLAGLKCIFKQGRFDWIVFAHHADDLLETRLIRLLRGSGRQGLRAMSRQRGRVLRPLIDCSRAEIDAYARERQLDWVEDPSNAYTEPLRNWLRHEWLPLLDAKSRGARGALSRSLDLMSEEKFSETIGPCLGLRREALREATPAVRRAIVARYLRALGLSGYTHAHVEEILKRVSSTRPIVDFELLGLCFQATPDFLWASRV